MEQWCRGLAYSANSTDSEQNPGPSAEINPCPPLPVPPLVQISLNHETNTVAEDILP